MQSLGDVGLQTQPDTACFAMKSPAHPGDYSIVENETCRNTWATRSLHQISLTANICISFFHSPLPCATHRRVVADVTNTASREVHENFM